ncbi:MAG: cache domain-containing protein [Alphaproteobacteria bacterium]|nr:cache domain-containing protein [Alphaproteobacteria bacterium]
MKLQWIVTGILAFVIGAGAAQAAERGTKAEAEAMVKKAVEYIKANGAEKAYAEFGNKSGPFVDRDLYVMVYDLAGKCVAHGQNPGQVGKDMVNAMDPNGKAFVKERVELAKTKNSFWQEYSFKDPLTKKVEPKEAYCEKLNETLVCSGIYKPI